MSLHIIGGLLSPGSYLVVQFHPVIHFTMQKHCTASCFSYIPLYFNFLCSKWMPLFSCNRIDCVGEGVRLTISSMHTLAFGTWLLQSQVVPFIDLHLFVYIGLKSSETNLTSRKGVYIRKSPSLPQFYGQSQFSSKSWMEAACLSKHSFLPKWHECGLGKMVGY